MPPPPGGQAESGTSALRKSARGRFRFASTPGTAISRAFSSGFFQEPPGEDHEKRSEKGGDEVLERHLQLPEPEINSQQPEQQAADHCAGHADEEVQPAAQAFPFQRNHSPGERSRKTADDYPDDDFTNGHVLDAWMLCANPWLRETLRRQMGTGQRHKGAVSVQLPLTLQIPSGGRDDFYGRCSARFLSSRSAMDNIDKSSLPVP